MSSNNIYKPKLTELEAYQIALNEIQRLKVENEKLLVRSGWLEFLETEEGRKVYATENLRIENETLKEEIRSLRQKLEESQ